MPRHQFLTSLLVACMLWLAFGPLDRALARVGQGDFQTAAERWAWSQIKQGEIPDFNKRCGTPALEPKNEEDTRWQHGCRSISSRFLVNLLTRPPWRDAVAPAGVRITGARIIGNIDSENARLVRAIEIFGSRIEGAIILRHANTASLIRLDGSLMNGEVIAEGLHAESDVFFVKAVFNRLVRLDSAKIDGDVDMTGASFNGALNAQLLQVRGSLGMASDAANKASFKDVMLRGAKITGQIDMTGASFDGKLDADSLQVGGSLRMYSGDQNKASFKEVVLQGAKIAGQLSMTGASFDGKLDAESLQVGAELFLYLVKCTDRVRMVFAHVGGGLGLRGADLADLDLSGASIAGDLALGEPGNHAIWREKNGEPGGLTLKNTHTANLVDAQQAWPEKGHLHLDGFTFNHLGGFEGETGPQMRARGIMVGRLGAARPRL